MWCERRPAERAGRTHQIALAARSSGAALRQRVGERVALHARPPAGELRATAGADPGGRSGSAPPKRRRPRVPAATAPGALKPTGASLGLSAFPPTRQKPLCASGQAPLSKYHTEHTMMSYSVMSAGTRSACERTRSAPTRCPARAAARAAPPCRRTPSTAAGTRPPTARAPAAAAPPGVRAPLPPLRLEHNPPRRTPPVSAGPTGAAALAPPQGLLAAGAACRRPRAELAGGGRPGASGDLRQGRPAAEVASPVAVVAGAHARR
jgi:hypothetical protein